MSDKPTTPLPTVHLGGTSHKKLSQDYEDAYYALKTFTKTFGHIEFNARDYFVQGPEAWTAAAEARIEMNEKIRDLVKYIEDHLESLAEQAPKK